MTANELGQYLAADEIIDGDHPRIVALSVQLRDRQPGRVGYARAAYEYVRDRIAHSFDVEDPRVSISASETLANGVGLCFAKARSEERRAGKAWSRWRQRRPYEQTS